MPDSHIISSARHERDEMTNDPAQTLREVEEHRRQAIEMIGKLDPMGVLMVHSYIGYLDLRRQDPARFEESATSKYRAARIKRLQRSISKLSDIGLIALAEIL